MATKLWITSAGKVILSNNNSKIPNKILRKLIRMIEANSADIGCIFYTLFSKG